MRENASGSVVLCGVCVSVPVTMAEVCVCVCACVCVCVLCDSPTHTHTPARTHTRTHTHTHSCTHSHTRTHTHAHTQRNNTTQHTEHLSVCDTTMPAQHTQSAMGKQSTQPTVPGTSGEERTSSPKHATHSARERERERALEGRE